MSPEIDKDMPDENAAGNGRNLRDRTASGKGGATTAKLETMEALAPPVRRSAKGESTRRALVRVPENLHDIIAGIPITPEEAEVLRRRRSLNVYIHRLLTAGLAASTVTMLAGIALGLLNHVDAPSQVPRFTEALKSLLALQPSGFLALGLLILIMTPILRVAGSFIAFLYERDWRFAGLTFLVLLILSLSLISGRG
jgi:uncharacterized membrane protein